MGCISGLHLVTTTIEALLFPIRGSRSEPAGRSLSSNTGRLLSTSKIDNDGCTCRCWNPSSRRITSGRSSFLNESILSIPFTRFFSTTTSVSGNFCLIWSGSSPASRTGELVSTTRNPLLFRLYPRLSTATLYCFESSRIRYSTCGVFPVPPTVMLPTQITGMSNFFCSRMFRLNNQFRMFTPIPYNQDNGSNDRRISTEGFSIFKRTFSIIEYLNRKGCELVYNPAL